MQKKQIPDWMDFNTIYFFEYNKKGDISEFKKKLPIDEIECIILEKEPFSLKLQFSDRYLVFHFKSAFEQIMWLEGL